MFQYKTTLETVAYHWLMVATPKQSSSLCWWFKQTAVSSKRKQLTKKKKSSEITEMTYVAVWSSKSLKQHKRLQSILKYGNISFLETIRQLTARLIPDVFLLGKKLKPQKSGE